MKKKALLLASMGALVCTVGITALAVGGANHLDAFPVKADPTGYEITFNESNTTVEKVLDKYAIYTTTPRGAKVGVVGVGSTNFDESSSFTFKGTHFRSLWLFDHYDSVLTERAYEFSHITGFAISFEEGGDVSFDGGDTYYDEIVSGEEYKGLSITSDDSPQFIGDNVTVTSLTIWYSCENL